MPAYYIGYLYILISAAGFGIASILIKWAYLLQITPLQLLTLQNIIATSILWLFVLIFRVSAVKVSRKQFIQLLIQGILGNLASSLLFFTSLKYVSASMGIVLLFTYPAMVNMLAFFFYQEKLTFYRLLAIVLTLVGTVLTINLWQSSWKGVSFLGIAYGLLSALATAFLNLYGQKILTNVRPLTTTIYPITFSTVSLCLIQPPLFLFGETLNWQVSLLGLILATTSTILPLFTLLKGISLIGASKASIISTSELPFTITLAYLLLGEKMNLWQLVGALLILISILILQREEKTA